MSDTDARPMAAEHRFETLENANGHILEKIEAVVAERDAALARVGELEAQQPGAILSNEFLEGHQPYTEELAGVVAFPSRIEGSLLDFARRVRVTLEREQESPACDTALVALLCDAARIGAENIALAAAGLSEVKAHLSAETRVAERLREAGARADRHKALAGRLREFLGNWVIQTALQAYPLPSDVEHELAAAMTDPDGLAALREWESLRGIAANQEQADRLRQDVEDIRAEWDHQRERANALEAERNRWKALAGRLVEAVRLARDTPRQCTCVSMQRCEACRDAALINSVLADRDGRKAVREVEELRAEAQELLRREAAADQHLREEMESHCNHLEKAVQIQEENQALRGRVKDLEDEVAHDGKLFASQSRTNAEQAVMINALEARCRAKVETAQKADCVCGALFDGGSFDGKIVESGRYDDPTVEIDVHDPRCAKAIAAALEEIPKARALTEEENAWALDLIRRYVAYKKERAEPCPPGPGEEILGGEGESPAGDLLGAVKAVEAARWAGVEVEQEKVRKLAEEMATESSDWSGKRYVRVRYVGDHPNGYKDGTFGRYFADELRPLLPEPPAPEAMLADRQSIYLLPVAYVLDHWRPGSFDRSWEEEFADLGSQRRIDEMHLRTYDAKGNYRDELLLKMLRHEYVEPVTLGWNAHVWNSKHWHGTVWAGHHRIWIYAITNRKVILADVVPHGEGRPWPENHCAPYEIYAQNPRVIEDAAIPIAAPEHGEGG